ncbi:hypothetical protein [Kitasatospora indigofera]|uniref:hypothetical protein n=1 Tax=Kitasatospora indigofera TaxID=67307 RepID=UPI0036BC2006
MADPQPTAAWTRLRQAVHAASADWWTSPRQTDDQTNQLYAAIRAEALAAAAARVAALPTANDGQLIAAFRDVVLNTITAAQEG